MTTSVTPAQAAPRSSSPRRARSGGTRRGEGTAGWLFVSPVILILGIFLFVPVLMALWVSFSDWSGRGSPLSPSVGFVGLDNYAAVTTAGGLPTRDFGIALRNNAWYVLLVVPLQTAIALMLAVFVSRRMLRGRGFFRTAFYFPSVTSSVAITVLWLFLFSFAGPVNAIIQWFGGTGPNWLNDPRGIVHVALGNVGLATGPDWLTSNRFLGISWWEWTAGPSIAMFALILMAVFTTSGTFMLLFIAALQNVGYELTEAAMMDGANAWQRFWRITLPQLRPTLFTVITLGLIGCWQVFDQIYTGTQGGPAKTTVTPAYLSYTAAFQNQNWGIGAAIAFMLFLIIIVFTIFQRWVLRDRPVSKRRIRAYQPRSAKEAVR
ncbi:MAG: ABC transporter permease [Microbacterium sp. SCN 70-200]|uniref:carbohydrate ABC transporter permease n=1 Tax=unclassified Microbacterium TaxID=2609290 RepID=UPI00086F9145|nr:MULTISPECIES: sugar ABC transporter permease [unclassified Microbacterium]MBN9213473.1 sugar ABC transporter permease [Microbacterium sp.]ODT41703.1 MAG: ABC transporter permease [Microbacterium sp. SCN 70-200]OJV85105.1 MAG: ABC transporter permease [Microbacterium sp. 70-16]